MRISRLGSFMFVLHIQTARHAHIYRPKPANAEPAAAPARSLMSSRICDDDLLRLLEMEGSMEKQETRFQDWTNLAVGFGLAIYPWVIGYSDNLIATRVSVIAGV